MFFPMPSLLNKSNGILGRKKDAIIEQEVQKLLKAGHIREMLYPEWLSSAVLVKNAEDTWCIDFSDLNKATPKDHYPLPRIDQ